MEHILHLKNNISEVPTLGEWVEAIGEEFSLPSDKIFQLNLALEEVVVNIMNYAYPGEEGRPVDVSVKAGPASLVFTVDDQGLPFDPTAKEDPDITLGAEDRPIGGLGILLVRQLMNDVAYRREDGHNLLTLSMNI